ncbi:MAG: hypothetical protein HC858_10895, partial [Brachymonas sp.]|nr:hypothetical protein [Brachymonas sp.]
VTPTAALRSEIVLEMERRDEELILSLLDFAPCIDEEKGPAARPRGAPQPGAPVAREDESDEDTHRARFDGRSPRTRQGLLRRANSACRGEFPHLRLAAAAALKVDPKLCAVIEDSTTGARAGVAAGCTVLAYCPDEIGHSSAQAMREVGASAVFGSMLDLPGLLVK